MKKSILKYIVSIISLIVLCVGLSIFFFRIDLTSEKRYTLSKVTKETLKNLKDTVNIEIYVTGDLPVSFKRLEKRIKETMEEFKVYGKSHIQYSFVDISTKTEDEQKKFYEDMTVIGLNPINLQVRTKDGGFTQKMVYPGALIRWKDRKSPVNILVSNLAYNAEQNLNSSIECLEYSFISTVRKITHTHYSKIAFVEGHGELNRFETADITKTLYEFYDVARVNLNKQSLDGFDCAIIAGADSIFPLAHKKIINDFVLKGGKTLWLLDGINARLEDLSDMPKTYGLSNANDLQDLLFKYGVRVNFDLVMDAHCIQIPVNIAPLGQKPQFAPAPWYFSPLLSGEPSNPITKDLNYIHTNFVSSIDTINPDPKVKKTVLMKTSMYSQIVKPPVQLSLQWVNKNFPQEYFTSYSQNVAVLLEGQFPSAFDDVFASKKTYSKATKMIVISDASIIWNDYKKIGDNFNYAPLGFDRFSKQTFGNKDFMVNCINYLCGEEDVMSLRSKNLKMRLLDAPKVEENKTTIILINTALPIILVLLAAAIVYFFRKRRYTK